jgi:hypothetical protein
MNILTSDKLPNSSVPSSTTQVAEADQLRQQLHDERQRLQQALLEIGLLRHALRTLSSQVQSAMPAMTALVDHRDGLATAWAQAQALVK